MHRDDQFCSVQTYMFADLHALGVEGRSTKQAGAAATRMLERLQLALLSP